MNDDTLPFTSEAHAEVKRNLLVGLGGIAGFTAIMVFGIVVAIDSTVGYEAVRIGSLILIGFCLPMISVAGIALTLAYLLDCWPAFIRARRLTALYGIEAADVSNPAMRRRMWQAGYWGAFAKGVAAGLVFVVPWLGITWATRRTGFPGGLIGPAGMMVLFAGGGGAKAWVVRQVAAERQAKVATQHL